MRESSFMIIVPMNPGDLKDPKTFIDNLKKNPHTEITNMSGDDDGRVVIDITLDGKPYTFKVAPIDINIPQMVRPAHFFSDKEMKLIDKARTGLGMDMMYEGDSRECFYDQLRIINAMYPDILGVLDCPSEKLISGKWLALAASSETKPAPKYLYTVQAISGDDNEVWLHTHGLKRCGMYELEVLYSNTDTYTDHYNVIENFATRMLEADEPIQPGDPVYLAQAQGIPLVATAVDWKEAIKFYPDAKLGTAEDRQDEVHGEDTCAIMCYKSDEDEENKVYTRIQGFDRLLTMNPMFMISTKETDRMRKLAIERVPYMTRALKMKDVHVLVKIGLITDKEHWNEDGTPQREHIWFELKDVKGDQMVAELTQEPYYVSGIGEGYIGTYPFSDITDWIIFTKERRITPDDAYLLDY